MQVLADDLEDEPTGYRIELLGINFFRDSPGSNVLMTAGRSLPWLQDTFAENAQAAWSAAYRDVIILGPENEHLETFNLTAHDLQVGTEYEAFKALLKREAKFRDSDIDTLGDDWEQRHLGGTGAGGGGGDNDGDGAGDYEEFAFGSLPGDGASRPATTPQVQTLVDGDYFAVTFRRRLGTAGGLIYMIEVADGSGGWTGYDASSIERIRVNPYDGSGTVIVTCRLPDAVSATAPQRLVRVRALSPVP